MCPRPASSESLRLVAGDVLARRSTIVPACRAAQPGDRVDQLGLPVAVDAGDADDLAAAHVERHAAHLLDARARRRRVRSSTSSSGSPGCAGAFSTRSSTSRPTISRASPPRSRPRAGSVSTFLPRRRTVIRSAISSTSFSLWLMKMIDLPCVGQAADDGEQLLRLLRRQHRGRLVEDEDVGAAVERLQDLDALLLADGDVLDQRARVDGEPEARRDLARPASRPRRVVEEDAVACAARSRARCSRRRSSPGSA